MKQTGRFMECIEREAAIRKNYLQEEEVETIYFGGGTPSVIAPDRIQNLITVIRRNFNLKKSPEITLEANPDDLTEEYLDKLVHTEINRISIGIQSFHDDHLKWMNRRHSGREAENSILRSQRAGFKNISVDLIYGFPGLTKNMWREALQKIFSYGLPHLSCYMLGIEPKTVFGVWQRKGRLKPVEDQIIVSQFYQLLEETQKAGYDHYEISNFCLPGNYSRHNTSYWFSKKYLGLGPSANSYDQNGRQWNVRSLEKYMNSIEKGIIPAEGEIMTPETKYNEYILTSLRTKWGVNQEYIEKNYGKEFRVHFLDEATANISKAYLVKEGEKFILSPRGMIFSDEVISSLLFV